MEDYLYNDTVFLFLQKNHIEPNKINNNTIMTTARLNSIVERYGLFKDKIKKNVSIADIYGMDSKWDHIPDNIFEALNSYFDETGTTYQYRACDRLLYTAEEMLSSTSFQREPVVLKEINPDMYVVSNNGMHRYMALRVLFLGELHDGFYDIHHLREKYTINAYVEEVDEVKTYCNFILSSLTDISLKVEYDDNFNKTGKVLLRGSTFQNSLDDNQLISFTREILSMYPDFINCNIRHEQFRSFVENVLCLVDNKENHYGK